jgi:O-succinylbenzoic acid--CoA ligase
VIPWEALSTETLLNPRLPSDDLDRLRRLVARAGPLAGHVWLATSGVSARLKPVALAKRALLASAAAVNDHLRVTARDVWLNPLPAFHVGGLGIHARAHLSGTRVATLDAWAPGAYRAAAAAAAATLSALVPTQVFDLVRAGQPAPATLRAVVVGGGALALALYRRARALGWPLLPSYGATECGSQAATADLASLDRDAVPDLRVLPHLALRAGADGRIEIRGASLLTGYATDQGLDDPKRDGWWRTGDLGLVREGTVTVAGRAGEVVKVLGESVAVGPLQLTLEIAMLDLTFAGDAALYALPDERAGWRLGLAYAGADPAAAAALGAAFNDRVAPYERVSDVVGVARIPRSALGKVMVGELGELVGLVKRER